MAGEQASEKQNLSLTRGLVAFWTIAVISSAMILWVYWHQFGGPLSSDQSIWAQFGTFTGGTVGTIVSFSAFLALLVTIRIQSATLEVSQRELRSTSESARAQAEYFKNKELVDDLLDSIKDLEAEIYAKRGMCLAVTNNFTKSEVEVPLSHFLDRDTYFIAGFSPANKNLAEFTHANLHLEFMALFQVLFDLIMTLKEIPATNNRYRVLMHKHLETFFYLTRIDAFDETNFRKLDFESTRRIDQFKHQLTIQTQRIRTAK